MPTIFAVPDYEATLQTFAEYLNDNANSADTVDVPSSPIPITDQLGDPLSLEEIALVQETDLCYHEMARTVGKPPLKYDVNIVGLFVLKSPLDSSLPIVIMETLRYLILYLRHLP